MSVSRSFTWKWCSVKEKLSAHRAVWASAQVLCLETLLLWDRGCSMHVPHFFKQNVKKTCTQGWDFMLHPGHSLVVVQLLSHSWLFATPWTAARQASLSFTISWSLFKFMSIESVMPSNHLILCHPLLLLLSFPNIRVFSSESGLHIRWPKY